MTSQQQVEQLTELCGTLLELCHNLAADRGENCSPFNAAHAATDFNDEEWEKAWRRSSLAAA